MKLDLITSSARMARVCCGGGDPKKSLRGRDLLPLTKDVDWSFPRIRYSLLPAYNFLQVKGRQSYNGRRAGDEVAFRAQMYTVLRRLGVVLPSPSLGRRSILSSSSSAEATMTKCRRQRRLNASLARAPMHKGFQSGPLIDSSSNFTQTKGWLGHSLDRPAWLCKCRASATSPPSTRDNPCGMIAVLFTQKPR